MHRNVWHIFKINEPISFKIDTQPYSSVVVISKVINIIATGAKKCREFNDD